MHATTFPFQCQTHSGTGEKNNLATRKSPNQFLWDQPPKNRQPTASCSLLSVLCSPLTDYRLLTTDHSHQIEELRGLRGTLGLPGTVAPFRAWRGSRDLVARSPKFHDSAVAIFTTAS